MASFDSLTLLKIRAYILPGAPRHKGGGGLCAHGGEPARGNSYVLLYYREAVPDEAHTLAREAVHQVHTTWENLCAKCASVVGINSVAAFEKSSLVNTHGV